MSVATGGYGGNGGGDGWKPPTGSGHGDDHDEIKRDLKAALRRKKNALRALAVQLGLQQPQGQGAAPVVAPAPVVLVIGMADNGGSAGYATVNDGVTTLQTGGFGGCFGIILIGPGNTRSMAHINSWHWPPRPSGQVWNNLGAFQALAANATTAHIYHWPGYWAQGDGDRGDAFIAYFNLGNLNIVVHGNADPISVDPAGNVTP